jgi:ribonuclease J
MKITLYRPNQIGGCITEVESDSGTKIIIDLGHNLPQSDEGTPDEFDSPEAMARLLQGVSAVLYTHNHGDHVELFNLVPDGIPQYIGSLAARLLELKYEKLSVLEKEHDVCVEKIKKLSQFRHYEKGKPIMVGDIRITPFYVSHSATDSYMLKVECDGKTLLHTGDFREHGYLGKGLPLVLEKYHISGHVDALVVEGTNVGQTNKPVKSEQEVQACFKEIMSRRKSVFILCSSQDADRLESIYKAHWSGRWRPLVCDAYQKDIMMAIANYSAGQGPYYQFDKDKVIDYWPTKDGLISKMKECGFTMLVRRSDKFDTWLKDILPFCVPEETSFIYSMYQGYVQKGWSGYSQLTFDFIQPLVERSTPCLNIDAPYDYNHTSGHASTKDLVNLCLKVNPHVIIPIHKDPKSDFKLILPDELAKRVCDGDCCKDGVTILFDPMRIS